MSRLVHYSKAPLGPLYNRDHADSGGGAFKTPGLWVSVTGDDDWKSWCEEENFPLGNVVSEITLTGDGSVLWIKGLAAFDIFNKEFGERGHRFYSVTRLNWPLVRSRYKGLIIAPYLWGRRLSDDCSWYYGWDCASGVIWDVSAISEVRPRAPALATVSEGET